MKNLVLIVFLVVGCKSDQLNSSSLKGEWNIVSATKNGRDTKVLDRSSMSFEGDKLNANFLSKSKVSYIIREDSLIINLSSKTYNFKVNRLQNDTLELSGRIGRSRMEMVFVR